MAIHTYRTETVPELTDETFRAGAADGWEVAAVVPRLPAQTDYVVVWRRHDVDERDAPLGSGTGIL